MKSNKTINRKLAQDLTLVVVVTPRLTQSYSVDFLSLSYHLFETNVFNSQRDSLCGLHLVIVRVKNDLVCMDLGCTKSLGGNSNQVKASKPPAFKQNFTIHVSLSFGGPHLPPQDWKSSHSRRLLSAPSL